MIVVSLGWLIYDVIKASHINKMFASSIDELNELLKAMETDPGRTRNDGQDS